MSIKDKLKVEVAVWWIKGLLVPGENKRKDLTGIYIGKKLKEVIDMADETPESKKWWQSKTIIFNVLAGVVGIAGSLQSDKGIPPNVAQIFGTIVMIGNIALRFVTDQPLNTGGQK